MYKIRDKEWEVLHSSLQKLRQELVTYEEARKFACKSISSGLTKIPETTDSVIELPYGTDFHFIGRVDTGGYSLSRGYPKTDDYYCQFQQRFFMSFSTINKKNISRYFGRPFFIYEILPSDIVHIFPTDSNTIMSTRSEEHLTSLPSLWLTLKELEELTNILGVYNQITCKTKRNWRIIKPYGILAINELNDITKKIADEYEIKQIIIHPDEDAINYTKDLITDLYKFNEVNRELNKRYKIRL